MKNYYKNTLERLREQGVAFAQAHPAVAPLLGSQGADPDVERILEGTAFLSGLIEQRLDENFPEIVHGLLDVVAPSLLLPVPSLSLVQFFPLPNVSGCQHVQAGTRLASIPVDNHTCLFTVEHDMTIFPARCSQATVRQTASDEVRVRVVFSGASAQEAPLRGWLPEALPFFLHAPLPRACQWYKLLCCHTRAIEVTAGGRTLRLPASALRSLRPHEDSDAPDAVFTILRDYFVLPEKSLFLTLEGLRPLTTSDATQLEVDFILRGTFPELPAADEQLFALNVAPVSNLFAHDADPVSLSHARQDYRLSPQGDSAKNLAIYDIQSVMSIRRGGEIRPWYPYAHFQALQSKTGDAPQQSAYTVRRTVSPVHGRMEYHLSPLYDSPDDVRDDETLITSLRCYHHSLPQLLLAGDICNPTDSSPAMVTFSNIVRATTPVPPLADTNTLWQLFSYLNCNLLPLTSARALGEFLALHIPHNDNDPTQERLSRQRVEAIRGFRSTQEERLWKGRPMRGQRLDLSLAREGFVSAGELYLFGSLLDSVLARFATLNTYTRLVIHDTEAGEELTWPPRLGNKRLL